jgi:hypothetical protein
MNFPRSSRLLIAAVFSLINARAALADPLTLDLDDVLLKNAVRQALDVQGVVSTPEPARELCIPVETPRRRADANIIYGNGYASNHDGLQWETYEVSFGNSLSEHARFSVGYLNEGHPIKNYRDGFTAEGWLQERVGEKGRVEIGAGPYFSMNTTRNIEDQELNTKDVGVLASAAMMVYLKGNSGMYLRAQYNHVEMPGEIKTDAFLVGVGSDFGGSGGESSSDGKNEITAWEGNSHTTRAKVTAELGQMIEIKRSAGDSLAYSASLIDEGNNGLSDRKGAAVQAWYAVPTDHGWTLSAGAGPYLSQDGIARSDRTQLNGLISIVTAREIDHHWIANIRYNRVVSPDQKDQDMFMIGIGRKF